jgi:adenylate kinase family enzyme
MLHIPLFHLDKHFFEANWIQRNYQDFLNQQQDFVNHPYWIIDGNSSKSLELRYSRADVCLYFNFPRYLCYYRTVKRLFHKLPAIDDRAPGCQETVRWSLLEYMWGYEERMRPILNQLKTNYPNVKLIELRSDQDVILFSGNLLQAINQSGIDIKTPD